MSNYKFFWIFFFGVLLPFSVWSQDEPAEKQLELCGEIINGENDKPAEFVHIVNKNTNQGTVSDAQGNFCINMSLSDTLVFSSVGYDRHYFSLSQEPEGNELYVKILLTPSTLELQSVEVFAYKTAEEFKDAILKMEVEPEESITIPGSYTGPRREVKPTILNPISFVFGSFNKKQKEIRKLAEVQRKEAGKLRDLGESYQIVKRITGLEDEQELDQFLEFCQISVKKLETSSEYDLALAINQCWEEYQEGAAPQN
ncbi:MAG: carboxypeptidase-like regulatory domain-containing protein [Candidatus Cyclobacteriaceae bacterium M3_2C_046]